MLFKENDSTRRTPLSLFERVETGGSVLCKHGVVGSFWGLNESRRERKTGGVKRMSLLGWWETTGQARNEKEKERRREEKRKARMERSRVKRESALQENKPQARRTDQRESSKREKGGEWSQKKSGSAARGNITVRVRDAKTCENGWPMARAEGSNTDRNKPVIYIPVRGDFTGIFVRK